MNKDTEIGVAAAAAADWPEGLLERARKAHLNAHELASLRRLDSAAAERQVAIAEALASGRLQGRELTLRDLDRYADLWRNASESIGDSFVTVQREPDPIAQFRLQEDVSITVLEDPPHLVASIVWSTLNVLIAGAPTCVLLVQGFRVRTDRRREGFGEIVRRHPVRALARPAVGQVMFMRSGNLAVEGFLKGVGFGAAGGRPKSEIAVHHLLAQRQENPPPALRPARWEDLERCADLISRSQRGLDLSRPVSAETLALRLNGNRWGERPAAYPLAYDRQCFYVIERDGEVSACAGFWDRGRDVRETWQTRATGEMRSYDYAAALDLGHAEGRGADLAALLHHFAGLAADAGRGALAAPLDPLPEVARALHDCPARPEIRTLEWTPFGSSAPRTLGEAFIDLRYW